MPRKSYKTKEPPYRIYCDPIPDTPDGYVMSDAECEMWLKAGAFLGITVDSVLAYAKEHPELFEDPAEEANPCPAN